MRETKDTQARPVLSAEPEGRLGIIPLSSAKELGDSVNEHLVTWRNGRVDNHEISWSNGYARDSYIVAAETPRFGSGEGKAVIKESVRGDDLYLLVDVCNDSLTYRISGFENVMSPDDHFQDLKRVISAIGNNARRITVIMPYLYEGRRNTREERESFDCANALQELVDLGATNIITFDAHDERVQNSIPLAGFESFRCSYQFIKNILRSAEHLQIDGDHMLVVSPDEAGAHRAIYLANVLGVGMGMFYKRRDYSRTVEGVNPIVAHEFLAPEVRGKDAIIVDDMISSGGSVLETAALLKERGANRIFICSTFGIFTVGFEKFDKAYREGLFEKLITTNLVYQPPAVFEKEYYISCDMSKYVALIIDTINHDASLAKLLDPADRIHNVVEKYRRGEPI